MTQVKTKGVQLQITPNATQQSGLNMLRSKWREYNSFQIYAPVGSGKTGLAAFIIAGFRAAGRRVMFVAPYTILLEQTAARLTEYGLSDFDIGFVWADKPTHPDAMIQIASAQTIERRGVPDNIDLLIIDESHRFQQAVYDWIDRECVQKPVTVDCKKAIGLSGTPFAQWMGNIYKCLLKPVSMAQLIEQGALSRFEIYAPDVPELGSIKAKKTADGEYEYSEKDSAEVMGDAKIVGNIVANWLAKGENRPTICFCVNVAHANYVTMEFRKAGVNAEVMTAGTPKDERRKIVERYEQGIVRIIVNVGVLVAGFDSKVRCIIFAKLCGSEMTWIQSLGRGLRTESGKDYCLIFDHTGTALKLGQPDEIEYSELECKEHKSATRAKEKLEREEKKPKLCPSCKYLKPAAVWECPKCGFKPMMGEDAETNDHGRLKLVSKKISTAPTPIDKQRFWSELKGYQQSRWQKPLSDGWCAHTYREKFGEWPKKTFSDEPIAPGPITLNFIRHKTIRFAKKKAQ